MLQIFELWDWSWLDVLFLKYNVIYEDTEIVKIAAYWTHMSIGLFSKSYG